MKSILALSLFVFFANVTHAKSLLVFKTVSNCVTAENPSESEVTINVQEAQDGQSQMIVQFLGDTHSEAIPTKKILPPKGMAGAPIKYSGKIVGMSNNDITLAVGVRPVKNGKFSGRSATLTIDQHLDRLPMICVSAK